MSTQHYSNHRRFMPLFHFFAVPSITAILVGAIINLVHSSPENVYSASLLVALSVMVFLSFFFGRSFAMKAQDRAIRAEEQFRHYIITGKPMDSRLRLGQIIALRFASDDELAALTERAINEKLSPKEIKKAIKHWKGDYHRV